MSKKKEKGVSAEQKPIDVNIADIDLFKYCPQKIFYVLLANETDEESTEFVKKIIAISKNYEDISFLTFISYEDVIDLIENCDHAMLPPTIKMILKAISNSTKESFQSESNVILDNLAKLMKLKLIEVMYSSYVKAVTKMQKRKKLEADLKALTEEKIQSPKVTDSKKTQVGDLSSKTDLTKKTSGLIKTDATDYTNVSLKLDDDIIFDDDIHHHVSFYVFHGFYDPDLLRELIVNNNIDVQSVLKISMPPHEPIYTESSNIYSQFWEQIYKYFDGPERREYLENTMLMNYSPTSIDLMDTFEELLFIIRNISNIKLNHLNYIRHTEVCRVEKLYNYFPLECFTVYNNILQKIPMEIVNVLVSLDALLKQVSVSVDETFTLSNIASQSSYLEINTIQNTKCLDPCSIEAFFKLKLKSMSNNSNLKKINSSFRAHEADELGKVRNSYKKYGPVIYETSLKMLKTMKLITNFNEFEVNYTEIVHKHDRDPSTKTDIKDKEIVRHFLYLYLFTSFERKETPQEPVDVDLIQNLETYRKSALNSQLQTKLYNTNSCDTINETLKENLYDPAPVEYFWNEHLEAPVLLQQISKSLSDYMYYDSRYSPETDTLLIEFSNRLDEFGIKTIIYDVSLPTPICLRDFCKYTIIEESEWLENNKPPKYVRKCIVKEECQGAKKIANLNLYPEYSHLLETDASKKQENESTMDIDNVNEEISFDELVEEIKNYPPSSKLIQECMKSEKEERKPVYDLGTKRVQVTGAKTVFHSHDDVELMIDNTRFSDEHPKCSVILNCRNNSLSLHSGKFFATNDFNFNVTLADGTVIAFIFPKIEKRRTQKRSRVDKLTVNVVDRFKAERERVSNAEDIEKDENKVISVQKDYFDTIIAQNLLSEEFSDTKEIEFRPPESMLISLRQAVDTSVPIYKVNSNYTFLNQVRSEVNIPLMNVVKRILHNAIQKEDTDSFTKRYVPVEDNIPDLGHKLAFDTKISLPNGLYISLSQSQVRKDCVEVKQEYLCRNSHTELEEFRLFARGGYVLIKKIDGSITTLKFNGNAFTHEKLDAGTENVHKWTIKPCHCKNIEDYKKRVCKLLKKESEEADVNVSRRAQYKTKKGYVVNKTVLDVLEKNKIPYLKTVLLKFDGSQVSLEGHKMKVKQILHITFENNFHAKEVYYERGDGFRSTVDYNGKQTVEFADGTKITSELSVAKDLVDGYVYILLSFQFEHPNYVTVAYNIDETLAISLQDNVVLKRELDNKTVLNIQEDITATIDRDSVVFEKSCLRCLSKYTCNINIHPLTTGQLISSARFVEVLDSYKKHFYCDFEGICERNDNYIRGSMNTSNCNHYRKKSYKKMFVVNRNLSGETFWTDINVSAKKQAMSQHTNYYLSEYNDYANRKILVYKFKRLITEHYRDRFLMKNSYLMNQHKEPMYATFCVISRMIDQEIAEKFFQDLTKYFRKTGESKSKRFQVLQKMIKKNTTYFLRDKDSFVTRDVVEHKVITCKCIQQQISMADKTLNWKNQYEKYRTLIRNRDIPCYFKSEFCEPIKRKR